MILTDDVVDSKIRILNLECYEYHKETLELYEAGKFLNILKPTEYRIGLIKKALLQYRHEHSLFEVGDLVTHLTTRDILKVISIEDSNKHYRFIKVKAINPKNEESVNEFNTLWFQLKHATDIEIKQEYREWT